MHKRIMIPGIFLVLIAVSMLLFGPGTASAANAGEIDRNVDAALKTLYAKSPAAKALGEKAVGILVFPSIVKEGFWSEASLAKERSGKRGKRSDITIRSLFPMDYRSVSRNTGMRSFS